MPVADRSGPVRGVRLARLDGLRGLAALAVVLYHYFERSTQIYPELGHGLSFLSPGRFGVELFFVISGYVIYGSLARGETSRFVVNRLIRLYPTYWIALTITLVVIGFAGLPEREITDASVIATNYTMLQDFLSVPSVDGAYWTLAPELAFYAGAVIFWIFGGLRPQRLTRFLPIWLAASVAINAMAKLDAWEAISSPAFVALHIAFQWTPLFIAGIALHTWRPARPLSWVIPLLAAACGFLSAGIAEGIAGFVAISFVALVTCGVRVTVFLEHRSLVWLGTISYVLYLLHQNVGYVAIRALVGVGVPFLASATIALIGVVAIAGVLTRFVDEPVRNSLRKLTNGPAKSG